MNIINSNIIVGFQGKSDWVVVVKVAIPAQIVYKPPLAAAIYRLEGRVNSRQLQGQGITADALITDGGRD